MGYTTGRRLIRRNAAKCEKRVRGFIAYDTDVRNKAVFKQSSKMSVRCSY